MVANGRETYIGSSKLWIPIQSSVCHRLMIASFPAVAMYLQQCKVQLSSGSASFRSQTRQSEGHGEGRTRGTENGPSIRIESHHIAATRLSPKAMPARRRTASGKDVGPGRDGDLTLARADDEIGAGGGEGDVVNDLNEQERRGRRSSLASFAGNGRRWLHRERVKTYRRRSRDVVRILCLALLPFRLRFWLLHRSVFSCRSPIYVHTRLG
jgi:hypothetical protein